MPIRHPDNADPVSASRWLSRAALAIALIVVMTRAMLLETIRDAGPATADAPPSATAATVVILDWLSFVPALLVLLRRVVDRSYTLRFSAAHGAFAAIAGLALLSTAWAGDQYLALVSAGQLMAAAALMWAFSQIVRRWQHLRIVAAVCVGLLASYAAWGVMYESVELPALRETFDRNAEAILRSQNIDPNSFQAQQFATRLNSGALMGYTSSPNVFAALVVMLALVAAGCVAQRVADSRGEPDEAGTGGSSTTPPSSGSASRVSDSTSTGESSASTPRPPSTATGTKVGVASGGTSSALEPMSSRTAMLLREPPELGWAAVPGVAAAMAIYLIAHTGSKGAFLALPAGAAVLAAWYPIRRWLRARFALTFSVLALAIVVAGLAAIGYGLYFGGLPSDSLNFRWRYWVGSFGVLLDHPLLGVGWANFADPYQGHRLVAAVEGIKDPHNWLVRLFVELGILGGAIGLLWTALLAWSATRPAPADAPPHVSRSSIEVMHLLALPLGSLALYVVLLAGPLAGAGPLDSTELIKRILFTVLMVLAIGAVPIISKKRPITDDRPAKLVHASMVVGVATFLIMSLIDMGLFSTGPLMVVAMVCGGVLGVRLHARPIGARGQAAVIFSIVLLLLIWLVGLIFTVVPVVIADRHVDRARRIVVEERPAGTDSRRWAEAAREVDRAREALPLRNADYEELAALYASRRPDGLPDALQAIDRAVQANPASSRLWLQRGRLRQVSPDAALRAAGLDDFAKGVSLAPSELELRLEFADLLERSNRPRDAAEQIEKAIDLNEQLDEKEPARLTPEQVRTQSARIGRLRGAR